MVLPLLCRGRKRQSCSERMRWNRKQKWNWKTAPSGNGWLWEKKFVAKAENLTVGQLLDVWAEEELKQVRSAMVRWRITSEQSEISRNTHWQNGNWKCNLWTFAILLRFAFLRGSSSRRKERKGYSKDYIHSFPQSCSSPSALQYFQNSILRLIPCSILNCGIRRMKWICFPMRIWTEMSNQFHEKIMKDCLLICKKEPSRNTSNPDSLLCRASYWRSLRFGVAGRKSGRTMPYHKT